LEIIYLMAGGLLVTAASNGSNQIWERELDVLMNRTGKRPLPMGEMSVNEGLIVIALCLLPGLWMLYQLNLGSMLLGLAAFVSYVFIYTPMKRISTWAVFVGAFPGALPPMIGAVAGSDSFGLVAGVLFFVQFVWQFPHFWAIAWVAHNDYTRAGFKLLPGGGAPTKVTALQAIAYAVMMVPVGVLPYFFGISGQVSMWIVLALNVFIVVQCIRLYLELNVKAARRVMFSSYIYLPVVFLALLADKITLSS
jgi:protoheme IX farnesyltransferase